MIGVEWAERGWIPDSLLRMGIRALVRRRLREETARSTGEREARRRLRSRAPLRPGALHRDVRTHALTGGMMPSEDLLRAFPRHLGVVENGGAEALP